MGRVHLPNYLDYLLLIRWRCSLRQPELLLQITGTGAVRCAVQERKKHSTGTRL